MSAPAAAAVAITASAAAAAPSVPKSTILPSLPPFSSIGELHRGGSQLTPMVADLAAMNCCVYCVLRFINVKQVRAYEQSAEWLQEYTRTKVGWDTTWAVSGCPLCLDVLLRAETYWNSSIEPALRDSATGEWMYEIDQYSLNISEPILARIRGHAANVLLKAKYSRLQSGVVDLKEALRWQYAAIITQHTGGKFINGLTDFGFLLSFSTDVPEQEYTMIVSTLPRADRIAAARPAGDLSVPMSNNPGLREYKNEGASAIRKRGKKNPRADVMGQKSVQDALPRIKPEQWAALNIFTRLSKTNATPATHPIATVVPVDPMDTSAPASVPAGIIVPANYGLPLSCLVPPPTLLLTARREAILVSGSYCKFYRFLSQSVWTIGVAKQLGAGSAGKERDAVAQRAQGAAVAEEKDERELSDEEDVDEADEESGDDDDLEVRRMTDSSVEEEIVKLCLQHFQAREYKFHSSGREDMDVRMLGNGRQFFLEFIEAKVVPRGDADFYKQLQATINANSDYVEVNNLHLSNRAEFSAMKGAVSTKRKAYRCVVWVDVKLEGPRDPRLLKLLEIKDLVVQQQTPVRVLHRRSLLTRPKTIYSSSIEYVNNHFFYLDIVTSSGTYVKEFVHGDRGRTTPNVSTLMGCHAEILQLDVIGFDTAVAKA